MNRVIHSNLLVTHKNVLHSWPCYIWNDHLVSTVNTPPPKRIALLAFVCSLFCLETLDSFSSTLVFAIARVHPRLALEVTFCKQNDEAACTSPPRPRAHTVRSLQHVWKHKVHTSRSRARTCATQLPRWIWDLRIHALSTFSLLSDARFLAFPESLYQIRMLLRSRGRQFIV